MTKLESLFYFLLCTTSSVLLFRAGISPVSVTHGRPLAKYFFFHGRKNVWERRESISQSWALLFSPPPRLIFFFFLAHSSFWGTLALTWGILLIGETIFVESSHPEKMHSPFLFKNQFLLACLYLYIYIYYIDRNILRIRSPQLAQKQSITTTLIHQLS